MTFASYTQIGDKDLRLSLSSSLYRMMQRFQDYREYRRTIVALRDLNAAQLADLGLHRSGIIAAAREAVYGTNV